MTFDVEAQLPGGVLQLVRGDLDQRILVFDGILDGQHERHTVRIPAGYDLSGRLRAVKRYDDGYCHLLVPRAPLGQTCKEGIVRI